MLEAGWPVFCLNEVRAKNINAAEAKPKQSIGVCVASVASILKLARSQEWLESPRQKILSAKDVTISKFSKNLTKKYHFSYLVYLRL